MYRFRDHMYTYIPIGDEGAYEYKEPWYGFSVNKNSDNKDFAVEFMRFLATEDEINKIASVKGMPSVAKNSKDEKYEGIQNVANVVCSYIDEAIQDLEKRSSEEEKSE